jgi:hypothetical protein
MYFATMFEILRILAVEQDYNIELSAADFDNFDFFGGRTFATAAQLQEILSGKVLEHQAIRATEDDRCPHNTFTRTYLINKYVKALRKCVPDVAVDQFSPKQRRLYIFYGQGQSRPAHHTHMAQLVIINFYIRHCKQQAVGDTAELQEFMMEFYGARPYRPSSSAPLTSLTLNTALVNEARRRGTETPDHEEFCKQFRANRIELALERHNLRYLKNQRRSPVYTRISNDYYVYSPTATPDEVPDKPGKRKKARLSGRFPGTSVKKTGLPARPSTPSEPAPPSRRSNQRQNKRKKTNDNQVITGGRAVSSRTPSSVDTEGEEVIPELRSAPRKPTSVSRTIPVAIPIA